MLLQYGNVFVSFDGGHLTFTLSTVSTTARFGTASACREAAHYLQGAEQPEMCLLGMLDTAMLQKQCASRVHRGSVSEECLKANGLHTLHKGDIWELWHHNTLVMCEQKTFAKHLPVAIVVL